MTHADGRAGVPDDRGDEWMTAPPRPNPLAALTSRADRLFADRPDLVLIAPYLTYLLLLGLRDAVDPQYRWIAAIVRGAGSLTVVWLARRHLPPLGPPRWGVALVSALLATLLWVAGQKLFNALGVPWRLPLFPGEPQVRDPADELGRGVLLWVDIVTRVGVAVTAVPVVEELFWRGFLLRALVDWHQFERIGYGQFSWRALAGTALLSTLQHPDNWLVSILLWLGWNMQFYRTRSLRCMMLTHALTNLALYSYVVATGDWMFW